LYIVFARGDGEVGRLNNARKRPWTVPKDAQPGDVALFYFGGSDPGIHAVGRTASPAEPGVPGDWTESEHGFFAQHADIQQLPNLVTLRQIRAEFPEWPRWKNLRGVRVHIVPEAYCGPLAELVVRNNPSARTLLSPWLAEETRTIVIARRRLRDSAFGRRVRSASGGQCAACASRTNYDELGILEAAHIRPVEHGGPDELPNALALCPNHHALLDEGIWTLYGSRIVLRDGVPDAVRRSFRRNINCKWKLDPGALEWHRRHVFKEGEGAG
jgi:hypothetical protein